MSSHFLLMLVFSAFVSFIFALLMRDEPKEQLRFAVILFGGLIGTVVLLGWLMYPLPL